MPIPFLTIVNAASPTMTFEAHLDAKWLLFDVTSGPPDVSIRAASSVSSLVEGSQFLLAASLDDANRYWNGDPAPPMSDGLLDISVTAIDPSDISLDIKRVAEDLSYFSLASGRFLFDSVSNIKLFSDDNVVTVSVKYD